LTETPDGASTPAVDDVRIVTAGSERIDYNAGLSSVHQHDPWQRRKLFAHLLQAQEPTVRPLLEMRAY